MLPRADSWIYWGLAGYLSNMFMGRLFGNNHYRFLLLDDAQYVCQHDNEQPLYWTDYLHPCEVTSSELFKRKAPLVMYMMEKRLGMEPFRKVI